MAVCNFYSRKTLYYIHENTIGTNPRPMHRCRLVHTCPACTFKTIFIIYYLGVFGINCPLTIAGMLQFGPLPIKTPTSLFSFYYVFFHFSPVLPKGDILPIRLLCSWVSACPRMSDPVAVFLDAISKIFFPLSVTLRRECPIGLLTNSRGSPPRDRRSVFH